MKIILYILLFIVTALPILIIYDENCSLICGFVMIFIVAVNEILKKLDNIKEALLIKHQARDNEENLSGE